MDSIHEPVKHTNSNMKIDVHLGHYEHNLTESIAVLNKMFETYQYDEIFLSFNGGKDCTVLLHLVCKMFHQKYPNKELSCLYVQPEDPFDEIEEFVRQCKTFYNISVDIVQGDVRTALERICDQRPMLKAGVMGCRRTDPYCENLKFFQKTDPGWPSIIRINPLLDWTCEDVWKYIHQNKVPYCSLYKYGYTSIGDKSNTVQNPHLKYLNPLTGTEEFKHADQLINSDALERAGRIKRT